MENNYKFKAGNNNKNFQLNFVWEAYFKNLIKSNLDERHLKEVCLIFQSIAMILTNLLTS